MKRLLAFFMMLVLFILVQSRDLVQSAKGFSKSSYAANSTASFRVSQQSASVSTNSGETEIEKTFVDERYGFSFHYPAQAHAFVAADRKGIQPPIVIQQSIVVTSNTTLPTTIRLDIWENREHLPLIDWFDRYDRNVYSSGASFWYPPDVQIIGYEGVFVYEPASDSAGGRIAALFAVNDLVVRLDYYLDDGGQGLLLFKKIIKTLTFLNSQPGSTSLPLNDEQLSSMVNATAITGQSCCGYTDPNTQLLSV